MNKVELVAAIAESANLTKAEAGAAVDAFLDIVTAELKSGEEVRLVGFGTFLTKKSAKRAWRVIRARARRLQPSMRQPA